MPHKNIGAKFETTNFINKSYIFIEFRLTLELSHDKPTKTGNLEIIVE
jgi:hypothetical protein